MKICIDVTEMVNVNFMSGIQRVVKEIAVHWIEKQYDIILLCYSIKERCFFIIDNNKYRDYYTGKNNEKNFITKKRFLVDDFNENMIFFDIDSVWMNPLKRSYLLPILKKKGVKIAAYIHDIIPVTETQYCEEFTTLNFLEYIGAYLQYSDLLITGAQATISAINHLIEDTNVHNINGYVVQLGSDIKQNNSEKKVRKKIENIINKGKYVLMVGTLEPRKNHAFVLDAFEKCLFEEKINLVFAGRIGWNIQNLLKRIQKHEKLNKQLFFIDDASDTEISTLYENCLCVAFPSYNEGFGLPIIEAFSHNALVAANDIEVLHEVGGDYCRYFSLQKSDEFISIIKMYIENNDIYKADKEKIRSYEPVTWDECAEKMFGILIDFIEKDGAGEEKSV